jgi:hypothetical protein
LNEALRIHSGPAWRIFQVGGFSLGFVVSSLAFSRARAFPDPVFLRLTRRWQDLERRARERYDALDRLDADLNWYWGQYNALDTLVEALRSPDRWLVYRVERVMTALVERDDALHRAREDLAGAHSVTAVGDRPRGPLKQWGNPHLNPGIETR